MKLTLCLLAFLVSASAISLGAPSLSRSLFQDGNFRQATSIPSSQLVHPEDLAKILKSPKEPQPVLIDVGFRTLFEQAHIPGSEYIGPASTDPGLAQLRERLKTVKRDQFIVIYCGCCPWVHCPNVKRAGDTLAAMGFTNFKILYIANNFGTDWVDKEYPTTKGN
ncbi:MAG TPA: rhodanese-like domain-containing protein [Terriglobales bacterium]|nr:rhodanese-like domain-containing protein [Terriglobales bacterium]